MDLLNLKAPSGTAWEMFIAVTIVLLGPLIVERFRVPGLIGLLLGGMLIGPNVLAVTQAHGGIVAELGEVGLLYLMFMAGVELDLAVFRRYRTEAVAFALLTFAFPMAFGVLGSMLVGYELEAAVLVGSLLASHTLVSYPIIRRYGLSTNRAVATTVGATVLTDTLALVVLAVVSGKATGDAGGLELGVQVGLGLVVLCAFCFGLLPLLGRRYFSTVGRERVLRYTFTVGALLGAAAVAEVVGIESIVGAFFAGLALNRLVPNEGEFMEHIEFFGSALLIPIFLLSVGTVIDPAVLVGSATLGLAAVFTLACVGGKAAAAALCRPAFRFSWDEVGVVFSLSVAQAAATLAATFVGLEIGLLSTSAVNAIMLLIVVSLVVSSATATVFGGRVPRPPVESSRLGRSVLVQIVPDEPVGPSMRLAARLAEADGGVVRPVMVVGEGGVPPEDDVVEAVENAIAGLGIDADTEVRHDRTVLDGIVHTAASLESSIVLAPVDGEAWLPALAGTWNPLVGACAVPVGFVRAGGRPGPGARSPASLGLPPGGGARRPVAAERPRGGGGERCRALRRAGRSAGRGVRDGHAPPGLGGHPGGAGGRGRPAGRAQRGAGRGSGGQAGGGEGGDGVERGRRRVGGDLGSALGLRRRLGLKARAAQGSGVIAVEAVEHVIEPQADLLEAFAFRGAEVDGVELGEEPGEVPDGVGHGDDGLGDEPLVLADGRRIRSQYRVGEGVGHRLPPPPVLLGSARAGSQRLVPAADAAAVQVGDRSGSTCRTGRTISASGGLATLSSLPG
ncbi:MAG: hypothetical protein GEV08_00835 [Acidimicrobiia bacterium]|nr:hypothetical protein [Acidimicrobiia bacterium]